MNHKLVVITLALTLLLFTSCKKDNDPATECPLEMITERVILNKQATIKLVDGNYYIVEDGTIDTRLTPCSLEQNFKVNNLRVVISGEVKQTTPRTGEPCCSKFFVINKIG